ncbi:isocitrate lyase/phosphoenolpyruvate mutase family protein [Niastella caeni]|uniref:Isocitrate lyase/phosphoenolpyruvate mutase family protein n=1 Tax=Niastella caeni TaxID=2569763 RepID=A0A4S8HJK6_9BACT|nr:isocitrate lyase/phosphoenolpyruvate mutase family protein [Niastella caeni]THU33032.1 isocitrate lyase/phosphoenolpyruvate mutase family protein [Niastella caeni]
MTTYQQFKQLHHTPGLFVLPNVWNAKSALLFQQENYPAIATSSAAVASSLGYEDGEAMPFEEYLLIIRRILATVKIPVSVDMEMGYSETDAGIYSNIKKLVELGVAGINIEDSTIQPSGRTLKDANRFAQTISFIKSKLAAEKLDLFINIRCDTYILNVANKQEETVQRLKLYATAGADGIFLPCISEEKDIAAAVSSTPLPINVMCIPGLPGFDTLKNLGVKRVSMGPFLFNKVYDSITPLIKTVTVSNGFAPFFS